MVSESCHVLQENPIKFSVSPRNLHLLSPVESFTFMHKATTPSSFLVLTFVFAQAQRTIQHESQDDEEDGANINSPH